MKTILSLAIFCFALSFCNLADRFTGQTGTPANAGSNTGSSSSSNTGSSSAEPVEKYSLTAAQAAILNGGKEMKWDDQGLGWVMPPSWKKMNSTPTSLQWSSNDGAFLIVSISPLPDNFPMDASLKAEYEGAGNRQKNGELEKFRYVEIDGVKGVEFVETMPYDKSGPRRHQWIALRKYAGRQQQINVMLSTTGSNFEKHRDEFTAIMSSTKITQ